jgi:hypothetical protein
MASALEAIARNTRVSWFGTIAMNARKGVEEYGGDSQNGYII